MKMYDHNLNIKSILDLKSLELFLGLENEGNAHAITIFCHFLLEAHNEWFKFLRLSRVIRTLSIKSLPLSIAPVLFSETTSCSRPKNRNEGKVTRIRL